MRNQKFKLESVEDEVNVFGGQVRFTQDKSKFTHSSKSTFFESMKTVFELKRVWVLVWVFLSIGAIYSVGSLNIVSSLVYGLFIFLSVFVFIKTKEISCNKTSTYYTKNLMKTMKAFIKKQLKLEDVYTYGVKMGFISLFLLPPSQLIYFSTIGSLLYGTSLLLFALAIGIIFSSENLRDASSMLSIYGLVNVATMIIVFVFQGSTYGHNFIFAICSLYAANWLHRQDEEMKEGVVDNFSSK